MLGYFGKCVNKLEFVRGSGRSAAWFSAPALGAGGRPFKSARPDHFSNEFGVLSSEQIEIRGRPTAVEQEGGVATNKERLFATPPRR